VSDKTTRLSQNILNTGIVLGVLGVVGVCGNIVIRTGGAPADVQATNVFCGNAGLFLLLVAAFLIVMYFNTYKLKPGYALIKDQSSKGVITETSWSWGRPNDSDILSIDRKTESFPNAGFIELHTPDDGVLGVKISVSYCPDFLTAESLYIFKQTVNLKDQIQNRIRSSLNSWIRQKPLPGTVRRALSMQKEMEDFIMANVTSTPREAALILHADPMSLRRDGYAVYDLGIKLLEINVIDMQPLQPGTGKPDWGDGEPDKFNAQAIFKQFHASTDNLSNLRKLKEALIERYPDETDDIEDIYDQVRISMKENREH
jgi:hypothetical protein